MNTSDFIAPMRAALHEAAKGRYGTFPNPAVGAVLLRDGQVVARGHHAKAGGPHAEVACLADARAKGIDPRGLTMAVTLEPCNHQGRTGPCSLALIEAGIGRVIVGAADKSAKAQGGAARLAAAGVEVISGVLEAECRLACLDWLTWSTQKRPLVFLKMASTLDGRIATRTGASRWVTGAAARGEVHAWRERVGRLGGCVLVGGSTLRQDNPQLTVRSQDADTIRQPRACVFARSLPDADTAKDLYLVRERAQDTLFFVPAAVAASDAAKRLQDRGVTILASQAEEGALPGEHLRSLLGQLLSLECPYVFCEGGGRLALMLLEAGLADIYCQHLAPSILGDNKARPLFDGRAPLVMDERLDLVPVGERLLGRDLALTFLPGTAWMTRELGLADASQTPDFAAARLWGFEDAGQD